MEPWHKRNIEATRQEHRKHLHLADGHLETVPQQVRDFHWLESLDLSSNRIRRLPDWLLKLKSLQEVIIYDNPIEYVPEGLGVSVHWSVIERLAIPDRQIKGVALDWSLPSVPGGLLARSDLQRLDLGRWSPQDEPPTWLQPLLADIPQLFPRLEALDLFYCELSGIPREFGELGKLRELDLTGNPFREVPDVIMQLGGLEELLLTETGISSLPDWLFFLPNLRSLFAGHNQIKTLPPALRHAVRLSELFLGDNPLECVPNQIQVLQKLQFVDFANTSLSNIPPGLFHLYRLRSLRMGRRSTAVRTVFSRADAEIKGLNRNPGQITEIPSAILKLTHLRDLDVRGHPITTPPHEVVEKGLEAIKEYWRQRQEVGTDYLCEAKLLILGEGGAGKSTLAEKLLNPEYQLDPKRPSTEGIEILRWRFPSRVHPRDGGLALDREFEVGIWDFGGQEIYHATHQFFLTHRSLYVLVADSRKEDTDFHYWLGAVALLVGDAPLIIVKNEKQDRRRDLDEADLRSRFPNVKEILATNLESNRGLDEVTRRIRQHLETLPHIGDALPATWRRVREALESDERDHISLEQFLELCGKHGFEREKDKLQLSAYLHDLGICLNFQDDPVLKHLVILRPSWGTDAVYRVLDDSGVAEAQGHFFRENLERIWDEAAHRGMEDELLRLMMKFQLCYELPNGAGYIAPQLLPASRPDYPWSGGNDLVLRWEYGFMPKGLLTRLTVATHGLIAQAGRLAWRSGVVLEMKGARLEAVEDYPRRQLVLRAQGLERKVLLGIVLHEMERIHGSFPRLEAQQMVPCNCPECAGKAQPEAFRFKHLQRAVEKGQPVQCPRSFEMVDAAALIDAVFEHWHDVFDHLPDGVRDVGWGRGRRGWDYRTSDRPSRQESPEVFISYAWKADTAIVDQLADALGGRGLKVVRDKNEMRYKDSIGDFMRRLGRGKAVVLVLSEAYLKSPSCMFELLEIQKSRDLHGRVFPVLLDGAEISKPRWILGVVKFWEQEIKDLDEAMKEVEQSNLEGIREDLDLYRKIRATIAKLTDVLSDMNALAPAEHQADSFAQLGEAIAEKIGNR